MMQAVQQETGEREDELKLTLAFDAATLRLEHSLIGIVVHLGDCATAGEPGGPALPVRVARIALPPGTQAASVAVEAREAARVTDAAVPLAPLQPLRPAAVAESAYSRPDEERWEGEQGGGCDGEDARRDRVRPYPTPPFVAPDPRLYEEAARAPVARLVGTETAGATPVATVILRPVRIAADGHLEFSPVLDMTIALEAAPGGKDPGVPPDIHSRAQALREIALTRIGVINPDAVFDYSHFFPIELRPDAEYLVITDNNRWDEATQSAAGAAGGNIVAEFRRLVRWKRQRGLRAKLVTIGEIVGGRWGDFRSGTRDLQETVRNFLKMAQKDWGVAWVLIGGDTGIVPVRLAAGNILGEIDRQADDPPPKNKSVWSGDHLRMRVVEPSLWWSHSASNSLVRRDDGRLIPYDMSGTSSATAPGWFFTTSDSYATRSAMPTEFVRVNGPASLADADLRFLYPWNRIPTDLYYSSLVGPGYGQPGLHDWDLIDNGIYGQSSPGNELDGVNYAPTVSLGRAPVNNATDAATFVDKIIAYEKFQRPDGRPLRDRWPGKAVLVSENWGGRLAINPTAANPPGPNSYRHAAGAAHSIIRLEAAPDWDWSLIAYVTPADARLMPYRTDAAAQGRGWHFCRSASDVSPSSLSIGIGGNITLLPLPSRWIVVYGAAEELAPGRFVFNNIGLDGSLADQEALREQLVTTTEISAVRRLYEDVQDMTPAQLAAGPVQILTADALRTALDAGPHIVSLSGHGWSGGCCQLDVGLAQDLTNGFHSFIAYADSCLTNQIDESSMSEALLTNPDGGAVAYVGSTRFSWISAGDDFQRRFFSEWSTLAGGAHLGLLADTRTALLDVHGWAHSRWIMFSLNLLGCPEMPVWWTAPFRLRLPELYLDRRLKFEIFDPYPPDPWRIAPPYRDEWDVTRVHIHQGDHEQAFALRGLAVDAPLEGFEPGEATVTVARSGYEPVVKTVRVGGGEAGARGGGGGGAWLAMLALLAALILVLVLILRSA